MPLLPFQDWEGVPSGKRELLKTLIGSRCVLDFEHGSQELASDPVHGRALRAASRPRPLGGVWHESRPICEALGDTRTSFLSSAKKGQRKKLKVAREGVRARRNKTASSSSSSDDSADAFKVGAHLMAPGARRACERRQQAEDGESPPEKDPKARVRRHVGIVDEVCGEIQNFLRPDLQANASHEASIMQEALANACQMDIPMILRPQRTHIHSESAAKSKEATTVYLSTLDGLSQEEAEVDGLIWESLSDYMVRLHAWCRGHLRDLVREPLGEGHVDKIASDADFPQGSSERHMAMALDELLRGSGNRAPTIQKLMAKVKQTLSEENRKRRKALQSKCDELHADVYRHLELDESETVETNEHLVEALKAQRGLMVQLESMAYNKTLPPVMPPCDQAVKEMQRVIADNSNHLAQMVQWSTQEADLRVKEMSIDDRESSFNVKEADQAVQAFLGEAGTLQREQPARARKRGVARRALMACIRSVEQLSKHSSLAENDERLSISTLMPDWGGGATGKDLKYSYTLKQLASLSYLDEEHIAKELQLADPLRKVETPDAQQRAATPPERSEQDKSAEMLLQVHGTLIQHLRNRIAVFQRSLDRMEDSLRVLVQRHAIKDVKKDLSKEDGELKKLKLELLQKVRVAQKVHRDGHNSVFELLKSVRKEADSYAKLAELRELNLRMERLKKRQEESCALANSHEVELRMLRALFVELMQTLSAVGVKDVRLNMDKMKLLESHASGREHEKKEAIQRTAQAFAVGGQALPAAVLASFLGRGAEVSAEMAKKVPDAGSGNDTIIAILRSQMGGINSGEELRRNAMPDQLEDAGLAGVSEDGEPPQRSNSLDAAAGAPRRSMPPRLTLVVTRPDSHRRTICKARWSKVKAGTLTLAGLRGNVGAEVQAESSRAVSWPSAFKGLCECSGQPPILANNHGVCRVGFLGELVADIGLVEPNRIQALPRYHDGLSSFRPGLEQLEAAAGRILNYWTKSGPVRVAGGQADTNDRRYLGENFKAVMVRSTEGVVAAIRSMMRLFRSVIALHGQTGDAWDPELEPELGSSTGSPRSATSRTVLEPELRAFARCCVMKRACLALTAWHNGAAAALEALRHGANLHNCVVVLGQLLFSEQITPGSISYKQSVYPTTQVDKAAIVNIVLRGVLDLQKLSDHLGVQEVAGAAVGQAGATYAQLLQATQASLDVAAKMNLVEPMPEEFYSLFRNYTHSLTGVVYPIIKSREDAIRAELEAVKQHLRTNKELLQADKRGGEELYADATRAVEMLTAFWRNEVALFTEVHNGNTLRAWRARLRDQMKAKVPVAARPAEQEHDANFRPKAPTPAQLDDWAAVLRAERAVVGGFALTDSERSALAWCLGSAAIHAQAEPLLIQICSQPEDVQWGFEVATNMDLELRVSLGKFDRGVTYNEADYLAIESSPWTVSKRNTVTGDAMVPRKSMAANRMSSFTESSGRRKTIRSKSKALSDLQDDVSGAISGSERDSDIQASEDDRSPTRSTSGPLGARKSIRPGSRPGSKAPPPPSGNVLSSLSEALSEGADPKEHRGPTTDRDTRQSRIRVMREIVEGLGIEGSESDWGPIYEDQGSFVERVCQHTTNINLDSLLTKYVGDRPKGSTKPDKVHQLLTAAQEKADKEQRNKRIKAMMKLVAGLNIEGSESWAPIFEDVDTFVERVCEHANDSSLDNLLTEYCGGDATGGTPLRKNKVHQLISAIQENVDKEKRIRAMQEIVTSLDIEGSESDWAPIYEAPDTFVERVCRHSRDSTLDNVFTEYGGDSARNKTKPKKVRQLITAVQEEQAAKRTKVMREIVTNLDIEGSESDWASIYEDQDTFVDRVCQHTDEDALHDLLTQYGSKDPKAVSTKPKKVEKLMELAADAPAPSQGELGEGPRQPAAPTGAAAVRQQAGPPEHAPERPGQPGGEAVGGAAIADAVEVEAAADAAAVASGPLAPPEDGQLRPSQPLQRQPSKPLRRQATKPRETSDSLPRRASRDSSGRGSSASSADGGGPGLGGDAPPHCPTAGGAAGASGDHRGSQATPAGASPRSGSMTKGSTLQTAGAERDLPGPPPATGAHRLEPRSEPEAAAPEAAAPGPPAAEAAPLVGDAAVGDGDLCLGPGASEGPAGSRSATVFSSASKLSSLAAPSEPPGQAVPEGPGDGGGTAGGDSETSGSEGEAAALAEVLAEVSSGESSASDAEGAPETPDEPPARRELLSDQEWLGLRGEVGRKAAAAAAARRQLLLQGGLEDVDNAVTLSEEAAAAAERLLAPAPAWRAAEAAALRAAAKAGLGEALVLRAKARAAAARAEAEEGAGRWARLVNADVPGVVYGDDPEVARLVAEIFEARIVMAECDSHEASLDRAASEVAHLQQRLEGIGGIDLRLHVPPEKLPDDEKLEADLKAGLLAIGASQSTLDRLQVGLRIGHGSRAAPLGGAVAELRGPPGAIAELKELDLSRLFVLRCQVDVLEHPLLPQDMLPLGPEERAVVEEALQRCEKEKDVLLEQLPRQRLHGTAAVCRHFHLMSQLHNHILKLWKQRAERASVETNTEETTSFVEGLRGAMEELFAEWLSRKDELADTIRRLSFLQEYVGRETDGELPPAVEAELQEIRASATRELAAFQEMQNSNVQSLAALSQLLDTIEPPTRSDPMVNTPSLKNLFAMIRTQALSVEMERQSVFASMSFRTDVDDADRSQAETDQDEPQSQKARREHSRAAEASTRARLLGLDRLQLFLGDGDRDAIAKGEVPKRMGMRDLKRVILLQAQAGADAVDQEGASHGTVMRSLTTRKSGGHELWRMSEKMKRVRSLSAKTRPKPIERPEATPPQPRPEAGRKPPTITVETRTKSKTDLRIQKAADRRARHATAVKTQVSFCGGHVDKLHHEDIAYLHAEDDARRLRAPSQDERTSEEEVERASDSEVEEDDTFPPARSPLLSPQRSPVVRARGYDSGRGSRLWQKTLTYPAGTRSAGVRQLSIVRPPATMEGAPEDTEARASVPHQDDRLLTCFEPDWEQCERLPRVGAGQASIWRIVNKARQLRKRRKQESQESSGRVVDWKFDAKIEAAGLSEDTIVVFPGDPDDGESQPRKGLLDGEPRQGKINRLKDMLRALRMRYREIQAQADPGSPSQAMEQQLVREDLERAVDEAQEKLHALLHAAAAARAPAPQAQETRAPGDRGGAAGRRAKRAISDTAPSAAGDAELDGPPRPRRVRLRIPRRLPSEPPPRQIGFLGNRRAITVAKRTRFSSPPRNWYVRRAAEPSSQEHSRLEVAGASDFPAKDDGQTEFQWANEPIGFIAEGIVSDLTMKAPSPPAVVGAAMLAGTAGQPTHAAAAPPQDGAASQAAEAARPAGLPEPAGGGAAFQGSPIAPPSEQPPRAVVGRRPPGWTRGTAARTQRQSMAGNTDDMVAEGTGSRQPRPPAEVTGGSTADAGEGDAEPTFLPPLTPPKIVGSRYFQPRGRKELTNSPTLPPINTYAPSSAREAIWHPDVLRRGPDVFGAGSFSARLRGLPKGSSQSRDNSGSPRSRDSDGEKYHAPRRHGSAGSWEPKGGSWRGSRRGSASPSEARSWSPPRRTSWSPSRRPSIKGGTFQSDRDLPGQRAGASWLPSPNLEGTGWYDLHGRRRGRREPVEDGGPVEESEPGSVLGSMFTAKTPGTKRQVAPAPTEPKAQLPLGPPNTFEELRMDRVWEQLLQEVAQPKVRPAPEARSPRARSPLGQLEHRALQRKASPQGKIRRPGDPGAQVRVLRPANPRLPVLGTPLSAR